MTNPIDGLRDGTLRVVPVEATNDMIALGTHWVERASAGIDDAPDAADRAYTSMLAAAPDYTADLLRALRDAERYRWLRDNSLGQWEHPIVVSQQRAPFSTIRYVGPIIGDELDAAIDAAMQRSGDE